MSFWKVLQGLRAHLKSLSKRLLTSDPLSVLRASLCQDSDETSLARGGCNCDVEDAGLAGRTRFSKVSLFRFTAEEYLVVLYVLRNCCCGYTDVHEQ